jgi:hypothetical protein
MPNWNLEQKLPNKQIEPYICVKQTSDIVIILNRLKGS